MVVVGNAQTASTKTFFAGGRESLKATYYPQSGQLNLPDVVTVDEDITSDLEDALQECEVVFGDCFGQKDYFEIRVYYGAVRVHAFVIRVASFRVTSDFQFGASAIAV